jgi:uncharacterized protein YbjT (DUF2867 family)
MTRTVAVTGAFGYSGRVIARQLLDQGHRVVTLTNSPHHRRPSDPALEVVPLSFDAPERLTAGLRGIEVLINTYWVRFNHRRFDHRTAVENTRTLFRCAREAGVERVVHVSITNPDAGSSLEYFRGKGELEAALRETGLPNTILRPAVLFGEDDILINNIAWFLRRFPVFGVPGDGSYRLQPIHVEDLARLAVEGAASEGNQIVEAIGPETFTFRELVRELATLLGLRRAIVAVPPWFVLWATRCVGWMLRDVVLTPEEIRGLMANALVVDAPPAGTIRLTEWARQHRATLGRRYASELQRRRS